MSEKIIGFALKAITTEQFALLDENYTEGADINFEVGLNFGYDATNYMVAAFFKSAFLQNNRQFIIIEAACHFQIKEDNWEQLWNAAEEKMILPKNFATHLAVLTVGTTRGILHAKTENTIFQQFFIPTVDVTKIITEDVVIENQPS